MHEFSGQREPQRSEAESSQAQHAGFSMQSEARPLAVLACVGCRGGSCNRHKTRLKLSQFFLSGGERLLNANKLCPIATLAAQLKEASRVEQGLPATC